MASGMIIAVSGPMKPLLTLVLFHPVCVLTFGSQETKNPWVVMTVGIIWQPLWLRGKSRTSL